MLKSYQTIEGNSFNVSLNQSDVYFKVFKQIGWPDQKINQVIGDLDFSLEQVLLDHVSSENTAIQLLTDTMDEIVAQKNLEIEYIN